MSASGMPPDFLLPCLHSIEQAVLATSKVYPQLRDKEVETIYEQFKNFYDQLARDKEMYEPSSNITYRQALIDAILQALDVREELEADEHYINNPNIRYGGLIIPYLEALYALCFGYLSRSARFWRKLNGPKGYLKFIAEQLP